MTLKQSPTRQIVDRQRLTAALTASNFRSMTELATAANVRHPTISRYLGGQTTRMNGGTIRQIADALRVPAEWLTGELESLPLVPDRGLLEDTERRASDDPGPNTVRLSWFLSRVDTALRRDLDEWLGEQGHVAYRAWAPGLLHVFDELASPIAWRVAGIVPKGRPMVYLAAPLSVDGTKTLPDNRATVDWLTQLLEPWLAGEARLNAEALRGVLEALMSNPRREDSSILDTETLRALDLYAAAQASGSTEGE